MKFRNLFISMTMAFILALGFGPLASEARADGRKCHKYENGRKHHGHHHKHKYEKKGRKNHKYCKHEKKRHKHYRHCRHHDRHDCRRHKRCDHETVVIIKKQEPKVIVQKRPAAEVVISIPVGSVRIVIRGEVFHFFNGRFYRPAPGGYRVVNPPRDAYQPIRPRLARKTRVDGVQVWVHNGRYFRPYRGGYLASDAPFRHQRRGGSETQGNDGLVMVSCDW